MDAHYDDKGFSVSLQTLLARAENSKSKKKAQEMANELLGDHVTIKEADDVYVKRSRALYENVRCEFMCHGRS